MEDFQNGMSGSTVECTWPDLDGQTWIEVSRQASDPWINFRRLVVDGSRTKRAFGSTCSEERMRLESAYHQRPEAPLQSACRSSCTEPGAQRLEATAGVTPALDPPSAVVQASAHETTAIARPMRIATGTARDPDLFLEPPFITTCLDCPGSAESVRSAQDPRCQTPAPRVSQERGHAKPLTEAVARPDSTVGGARSGVSPRVEGEKLPFEGMRFLLRAALLLLGGLVVLARSGSASADPLRIHRTARPPHSLGSTEDMPPRVSGESDSAPGRWLEGERLSGEWLGARGWLRDHGIELEGAYVADLSRPFRGGVHEDTVYRHWADLNGTFDLEQLIDLPGATVLFDAYSIWGDFGSRDTGDFQYYSNIDNPTDRLQLAELWWQQELFGGVLRIKLGKIDANSEFAFVDAGGDFINSSAAMSPTIFPMVTWPDPGTGALAFVDPEGPFYAGLGVFDGAAAATGARIGKRGPKTFFQESSDYFVIGEIGISRHESARFGPGRIAMGPWYHSASFDRFDGTSAGGTGGFFALVEQRIFALEPEREEGTRDLRLFAQYGWAEPGISEVDHHASLGVLVSGPWASRAIDTTGAMVTWVDLSDRDAAGYSRNETAVELFYRFQLTPFLSLKPDLQLIDDPGGTDDDTVVVGTLRLEVGL
jgi:porin